MASSASLNRGARLKFRIFFAVTLTVCVFPKANSLRCKKCESSTSFEECEANTTTEDCTMKEARCVHFDYEVTKASSNQVQKRFGHGCLTQSQCSSTDFPACKSQAEAAKEEDNMKMICHVTCCGKDLCNSQATLNSSVLFLLITLFVHVFLTSF